MVSEASETNCDMDIEEKLSLINENAKYLRDRKFRHAH